MAKVQRVRDLPLVTVDHTAHPYLLRDGCLSDLSGMVPYQRGGYRRVPAWASHYLASVIHANASFCGLSQVGPITQGGTAQITAAVNITGGNSTQYKILSNGTASTFGGPPTLGAAQNNPARVRYHRMGQKEFMVGWDVTAPDFGCHIFESRVGTVSSMCYLGAEPVSHSGVTTTEATTGGQVGPGYCRIYLCWYGGADTGPNYIGATDHDNHIDAHFIGTAITNKVTLGSLPTNAWTNSTHLYIYRTKVVTDQNQLDYEPAYLEKSVVAGTASTDVGMISDAQMVTRAELELGRYSWPYAKLHNKWLSSLGISEYQGRLIVWGAGYGERLHISGYIDNDGDAALDDNSWAFDVDLPDMDVIMGVASVNNRLLILGKNGIYRLRDFDDLPDTWEFEKIAALRNEMVDAFMLSGDNVFVIGRDAWGEYNVYACTGYELKRVGDPIKRLLSSHRLVSVDGTPMVTGNVFTNDADKRILYPGGEWGRLNAPANCQWSCGRYSTFQSGALLLANAAGVYYEGTTYSSDESDYVDSREFLLDPEEYSAWAKVYIHAIKIGANNVTAKVYAAIDGGSWVELAGSPITINDANRGIYELGLDSSTLQNARRIKIRVAFTAAYAAAITGITIQGTPTEWRK